MTLTPSEQKVYRNFYQQQIFTLDEARGVLGNYRTAIATARGLAKKGYSQRIKGGLYSVIPFEQTPDVGQQHLPDKYIVASRMSKRYFLSHHTALELHGAADAQFSTVYITAPQRIPHLHHQGKSYLCVQSKHFFGFQEIEHHGQRILVSDKERTAVDCLRTISHTKGMQELLAALPKLAPLNFEVIYQYIRKIDEVSLAAKAGFVLESLQRELHTPEWLGERLRKMLTKKTYYLDQEKVGLSRHVKEWRLMVPRQI